MLSNSTSMKQDVNYGTLSAHSNPEVVTRSESVDDVHMHRIRDFENEHLARNWIFEMEREWQKQINEKFEVEKSNYASLLLSRDHRIKSEKHIFLENPFYFSDCSDSYQNNGFGDHHLYGLYAGWPPIFLVDKQGYFERRRDFLNLAVEKTLSHKNSLLSSGSTTQIVGRICKEVMRTPILSLLRPKDPMVRKNLLDRHEYYLTQTIDHNKEALESFVANINFPKRSPIELKAQDPFPTSLKRHEYKQYRKKFFAGSGIKNLSIIPKLRIAPERYKIFPLRQKPKKVTGCSDKETQITKEPLYEEIGRYVCDRNKLELNKLKARKKMFLEKKRIPLIYYRDIHEEPDLKMKTKAFYDPLPKIETPWLTKMIKNKKFTRKHYVENFRTYPSK